MAIPAEYDPASTLPEGVPASNHNPPLPHQRAGGIAGGDAGAPQSLPRSDQRATASVPPPSPQQLEQLWSEVLEELRALGARSAPEQRRTLLERVQRFEQLVRQRDEAGASHRAVEPQPKELFSQESVSRRPLLDRPASSRAGAVAGLSRPPQGGRILVVDDDPENVEVLSLHLKRAGLEVTFAISGTDALRTLERESVDLVILDVIMPDLSGRDVLARLRSQYDAADLPVIMATALQSSDDVVEALRLGANDYVTKPLDFEVVLARVRTQLGLKRARDEIRELNLRLRRAERRIANLAESEMPTLRKDAAQWARSIAQELRAALGDIEVGVWLFDDQTPSGLSISHVPEPSAHELEMLRTVGVVHRRDHALIAVVGAAGKLLGVMSVETSGAFSQTQEHLVTNFARHLGSMLELADMRAELARSMADRRATEQDLVGLGHGLLLLCPECSRCYDQDERTCPVDGAALHRSERPMPYRVTGRYRLLRQVGRGAMGTVFHALDERLGREVAVKVVSPQYSTDERVRLRFEREARLVAMLEHPGIVSVHDSGDVGEGSLFMVMEWLSGCDLAQLIRTQGPATPQQVAELLRQVGAALSTAHDAGLVHRDIKPANIIVDDAKGQLHATLVDFGIAKQVRKDARLTQTGALVGTPLYMSPEQLLNQEVDARSDTYSLATVAYEALIGTPRVQGSALSDVLPSLQHKPRRPLLLERLRGATEELESAFTWALAMRPEERPARTIEWVETLAPLLEALPAARPGWTLGALEAKACLRRERDLFDLGG